MKIVLRNAHLILTAENQPEQFQSEALHEWLTVQSIPHMYDDTQLTRRIEVRLSKATKSSVAFRPRGLRDIFVKYFNDCLEADQDMMQSLVEHKVRVSNMGDENPITCGTDNLTSALGLFNGALERVYGKPNPVKVVFNTTSGTIYKFE